MNHFFKLWDESINIFYVKQHSFDTTINVKQESLFQLIDESSNIVGNTQTSLDKTVQVKRICVLYYCDYCHYKSTVKSHLKIHELRVHTHHGRLEVCYTHVNNVITM